MTKIRILAIGKLKERYAKEGRFFLQKLGPDDFNIALDIEGELLSSPELARVVEERALMAGKTLNFLIGGSLGLDEAVKQRCQLRLSFGRLTFPHQLFRVVVCEQVYRCFKIIRHETYHK